MMPLPEIFSQLKKLEKRFYYFSETYNAKFNVRVSIEVKSFKFLPRCSIASSVISSLKMEIRWFLS